MRALRIALLSVALLLTMGLGGITAKTTSGANWGCMPDSFPAPAPIAYAYEVYCNA